jgi:hypothetical protein
VNRPAVGRARESGAALGVASKPIEIAPRGVGILTCRGVSFILGQSISVCIPQCVKLRGELL